jgi:hypothetical protein
MAQPATLRINNDDPTATPGTSGELSTDAAIRYTEAALMIEPEALLGSGVMGMIGTAFQQMEWAEAEIAKAQTRHPAATDQLFHAFSLLKPTHQRMEYELVYRAHCRQILDQVAAGADTRPGTAAEICCACSAASLIAPLTGAAVGLYGRAWAQAFPELPVFTDLQDHYEALKGRMIDDLAQEARRQLLVTDRVLQDISCAGLHHGEQVTCRYANSRAAA